MTDQNPNTVIYAGFWIRVGASLIDMVVYLVLTAPALIAVYGWSYYDFEDVTHGFIAGPADLIISWIIPMIATIYLWVKYRATPGKMLLSLKVVKADTGAALTFEEGIYRYLGYFVSALPLMAGYFVIAFDPKKQGWHDKIVRSVVVRTKLVGTGPAQLPQD
jgi:uncharacterized RDD family membrane protein YckC